MTDKVQFELVSPEKLLLSEAVDMVVVPGTEGNFGVLPGHSPLISTIRPGMIEVYAIRPTVSERIFIVSGIASSASTVQRSGVTSAKPPETKMRSLTVAPS